jgi:outer membrane lipoprotein-sorting protein
MIRSKKLGTAIAGCLLAATALAVTGSSLLENHKQSLHELDALSTTYDLTTIGGTTDRYKVWLKKPNVARIETPSQTMVFDGETVTTYDKTDNTYFYTDQNENSLKELLKTPELSMWSAFYDEKAFDKWMATEAGNAVREGENMEVLELMEPKENGLQLTLYLSESDYLPRKASLDFYEDRDAVVTKVMNTQTVVASLVGEDLFAFVPPEGAEEIDPTAVPNEWIIDDLDEAVKLAKASGKPIILNFHATWCGPCKSMKAAVFDNDKFAEESGDFVLSRVDIDLRPETAQKFNVRGVPTTVFLDSNGNELFRQVGAVPLSQFLTLMNRAEDEA